jgi:invasion protein IalB
MKPGFGTTTHRAALITALLAAIGPATAWAQAKPPAGAAGSSQQFQDWRRECAPATAGKPENCAIRQVILNKDGKPMLAVAMGYFGPKREAGALFDLPLGLFLPTGVVLTIPGTEPVRVIIQTCQPQGCRAGLILAADVLAALKKADSAQVTVESAERKKLSTTISLKGFSKAFATLKK